MSHIFISHYTKRNQYALRFVSALENRGVNCWIAPRDIQHGTAWPDAIVQALDTCRGILFICCGDAVQSEAVQNDAIIGMKRNVPRFVVRIEDCNLSRLEFPLSSIQWLDCFVSTEVRNEAKSDEAARIIAAYFDSNWTKENRLPVCFLHRLITEKTSQYKFTGNSKGFSDE